MRKANIQPIYPHRHLTVSGEKKHPHPYVLKGLQINRPDQVWEIDISYITMEKDFIYLTAIIDDYSRAIMG